MRFLLILFSISDVFTNARGRKLLFLEFGWKNVFTFVVLGKTKNTQKFLMCIPYLNYSSTSCYGLFKLAVFASVRDVTDYFIFFSRSILKIFNSVLCFWRLYGFPPKHFSSSFPVWNGNKSIYNRIVYQYRR